MKTHAIFLILGFLFFSCSSAPKRPPEIFTTRKAASGQILMGNNANARGDYESAHLFLQEAWNLAASADDPELRVQVLLSKGNVFFNEGNLTEAETVWKEALSEAERSKNKMLIGASNVYLARNLLVEGTDVQNISESERAQRAQRAKDASSRELVNLKDNDLYTAFAWKVIALAEKELLNARSAEEALLKAVAIHEKNRYLEDAAYDWYLIASVRSKNGNYEGALEAIHTALEFDRRAENSNGLAMDWLAIGMIEEKRGNTDEALYAYTRAADIFRAAFIKQGEAEVKSKIEALNAKKQ